MFVAVDRWINNAFKSKMRANDQNQIKCPSCGSYQVHAGKRGWSIALGFIGSGKVILTCLKCGKKFAPGGGETGALETGSRGSLWAAIGVSLFLIVIMWVLLAD